MSATVVTLGGDSGSKPTIGRAATFEEAFGEYSDASGKRRKKKLERISDRREIKAEKQEARREKRGTRIANRDEAKRGRKLSRVGTRTELSQARQGRRAMRVGERQGRRDMRVDERQGRRTSRTGARLERREMRRPSDKEVEFTDETTTGTYPGDAGSNVPGDAGSLGNYAPSDTGKDYADEPTPGGAPSDDQGGGYAPSDEEQGGYAPSDDQGGYAEPEDDGYDQSYQDALDEQGSEYEDSEDDGSYEGEYEDEYAEELEAPFDGVLFDDGYSEIDDTSRVHPGLQDCCNKIEWNKTLVKVLENKRKNGNENKGALSRQILDRKKRIAQLESNVKSYEGAGADFSSADGMMRPNAGTPSGSELNRRTAETRMARRKAHRMMRETLTKGRRSHGGNDTPVDVELNPSYGKNRIEVNPRYSNAQGTGIIALDDADDYDATELDVRMGPKYNELDVVDFPNEMFMNADGSSKKINWTGIAVGVAVGAIAVLVLRKYKILK
jgi:hypothetical protein